MIKVGEEIEIVGLGESRRPLVLVLKCFVRNLGKVKPATMWVFLLRGVEKAEIQRGHVLAQPGSIKPHTKAKAQIYVLNKEEGGRHTPFFKGYRPQFFLEQLM